MTIFSSMDMKAYFVQLCAVRDKVSELFLSYLYLGNEMDALLFAETTWFTRVSRYWCLGRCEACPNLKYMTEPGKGPFFLWQTLLRDSCQSRSMSAHHYLSFLFSFFHWLSSPFVRLTLALHVASAFYSWNAKAKVAWLRSSRLLGEALQNEEVHRLLTVLSVWRHVADSSPLLFWFARSATRMFELWRLL